LIDFDKTLGEDGAIGDLLHLITFWLCHQQYQYGSCADLWDGSNTSSIQCRAL